MNLHKSIKGDLESTNLDGKYKGPMTAPGQKIKIYDMRKGKESAVEIRNQIPPDSPFLRSQKQKGMNINAQLKDLAATTSLETQNKLSSHRLHQFNHTSKRNPQEYQSVPVKTKNSSKNTRAIELAKLARELEDD